VKEAFENSRRTYGCRRITYQLKASGINCYKNKIAKIMNEYKIIPKTKRKYKITTNSNHSHSIAPNLVKRNFTLEKKNKVWVGDITYIWTREGWLYLSSVIDLFSRKIVGWSLGSRMSKNLVIASFSEAISQRKPEAGLVFHSDQGSQYASNEFRALIKNNGALPSMSRRGNCWDNAVAETFFKTLKSELIYDKVFDTKQEAELAIFEYIEIFYNRKRLHSTINYMSPHDYEKFVVA